MSLFDTIKKKIKTEKPAAKAASKPVRPDETVGRVPAREAAPAKKQAPEKTEREQVLGDKAAYHKKYALDMLLHPYVTEKAAGLKAAGNKYVFMVAPGMNKVEIAKAIRSVYGVNPVNVNVINNLGKLVRYGRSYGRRKDWRKAVVTLKRGDKIEVYEGV